MSKVKIPVGRSGFADIRRNGYYYIDKSGLIEELLKTDATQVTLITRPRRFGKTLGMSMLAEFFDIRREGRELFEGLAVTKNQEVCANWMNQYPVLFLTFKDVQGNTFESAFGMLESAISRVCIEHAYLADSTAADEVDRAVFLKLKSLRADKTEVKNALNTLIRMMAAHYGKQVILLLDEYDVPIAKASGSQGKKQDYYEEMLEVVRALISTAIKDNPLLKLAVITGCLRIAKESIFTGTNNFVSDTISDTRLNEFFGFTQTEVDLLLKAAALTSHTEEMKKWYDGYHFGEFDVYCPWDVMNHVNNLILNPEVRPAGYWKNSSDNAIIRSFIDFAGSTITRKFETLLAGGYVIEAIQEDLTYNYLRSSEENLWSVLYLTGYLTRVRSSELGKKELPGGCLALTIPNAEIREIFESSIKRWFQDSSKEWNRKKLFSAIWNGDEENASAEMTKLLRRTISYHDYKEDFYHAFFAGIFAGAGYVVESNKEHGEGRSDIIVQDYAEDRAAVFEVKYSEQLKNLQEDCTKALKQMDDRAYAEDLEEEYSQVICYGIAFYKKRCLLRLKT